MKKLLFALLFTATVTAVGCSPAKKEEPKPAEVPAKVDSAAIKAAADSAKAKADTAAKKVEQPK